MFLTIFVCESNKTMMRVGGGEAVASRNILLCVSGRPGKEIGMLTLTLFYIIIMKF
jgi:hypothetical protein